MKKQDIEQTEVPNAEKKLNIGLFIDTFFPMVDGVIVVVDNYARILSRFANVTVFTLKGRKKYDDSSLPYKVVRCSALRLIGLDYDLPLPKLSHKFKKALKESNLDIVHIHSPFTIGNIGVQYAKKHNIPVVATMHSQYKKDFLKETHNNKWLTNKLLAKCMKIFNACDECWAVNDKVGEIYFQEYGARILPKTRLNGADLKPYVNNKEIEKLRNQLGIKADEKVLFFVGRITVLKNIDFILHSLKCLKDSGFKFKMIFAGSGPDMEDMKKLMDKLQLNDEVQFLGRVTDREEVAKLYRLADLFLFPSLYDCNSLVQIEAASQSTPTLFLKGATTADTVTPNVNGYVADNDPQKYAKKIISIFNDRQKYNEVSTNAFRDLYQSWDDCVAKAWADYNRLIMEKKGKHE